MVVPYSQGDLFMRLGTGCRVPTKKIETLAGSRPELFCDSRDPPWSPMRGIAVLNTDPVHQPSLFGRWRNACELC